MYAFEFPPLLKDNLTIPEPTPQHSLAEEASQFFQATLNRLQSHNRRAHRRGYRATLLFGQLILELLRAHRLALVVQKLAVKRCPPLNSIELAGAACNIIHTIQCSRC